MRKVFVTKILIISCIIFIENTDPISEAYQMIHICNQQSLNHVEYINKFRGIKKMLMEFTGTMLDCCENMKEATLLLQTDMKLYKNSQMILDFPRIQIAIVHQDSNFVSHDFCQVSPQISW